MAKAHRSKAKTVGNVTTQGLRFANGCPLFGFTTSKPQNRDLDLPRMPRGLDPTYARPKALTAWCYARWVTYIRQHLRVEQPSRAGADLHRHPYDEWHVIIVGQWEGQAGSGLTAVQVLLGDCGDTMATRNCLAVSAPGLGRRLSSCQTLTWSQRIARTAARPKSRRDRPCLNGSLG
jgi:hypothetical protein